MKPTVRTITPAEHLAFLATKPSASFLQCPSWAGVKSEWGHESIGWYDEAGALVGAGLGRDLGPGVGRAGLARGVLAGVFVGGLGHGRAADGAGPDPSPWGKTGPRKGRARHKETSGLAACGESVLRSGRADDTENLRPGGLR